MKQKLRPFRCLLLLVWVFMAGNIYAQTKTITGKVTDPQGKPVSGATVQIKGKNTGTAADENGVFSLSAKAGDVLVVSAVNFNSQEVRVGEKTSYNVTLALSAGQNEEVIVTAMGIQRNRNTLPYAAQQITGDDMNKSAVSMNPVANLSGKVAGLQITQENSMGGSTNVILRGLKSLTQSNQALFVVDGVPFDNSNYSTGAGGVAGGYDLGNASQDLNPDNIASVSVLKGAAASALYGSRASNGVVLITTKKGVKRQGIGVTVNFGGTIGSMINSTLPTYQTQYGQGYDGDQSFAKIGVVDGFYSMPTFFSNGANVTIPETDQDAATGPSYNASKKVYNWNAFTPGDPNYGKATPWAPALDNKLQDFFVTPITSTVSVFAEGGGDKGSFKLGYSRNTDHEYIPNSSIAKNLLTFSTTYKLVDNLSVTAALDYSDEGAVNRYIYPYSSVGGQLGVVSDARQWWPTNVSYSELKADFFNTNTNATWNWQTPAYMANTSLSNIGNAALGTTPNYHDNPYWNLYKNYESDGRTRYFGNVRLDWTIKPWLTAMGRISKDDYDQIMELRQDVGSTGTPFYSRNNYKFDETNYDFLFNLNKSLNKDFNLKALLGGNLRQVTYQYIFATTSGGLVVPGLFSLSNSKNTPPAPTEVLQRREVGGVFAGATLDYKELLSLDATIRRDQSSTLPPGNNAYYYPSVSLNFQFGQLLKSLDWLSHAKAWVNYAQVGGDAPVASTFNTFTAQTPMKGQTMFATPTTNNNPNLVPEMQKSWETGIEASFLKERIGFNITYYHSQQINQIMPTSVSTATGFGTFYVNGGTVQNSGVELGLNLVPVRTRNFRWSMDINWSKNMQKVISLYGGQPSYVVAGFQNSVRLAAEPGKSYQLQGTTYARATDGQIVIDEDGYPIVAKGQYNDLGSPFPDWIGGINNSFKYKNFTLSFLIDMSHGGKVYSLDYDYGSFSGMYPRTAGYNSNGKPVRNTLSEGGGFLYKGEVGSMDANGNVTSTGKPNTTLVDESWYDNGQWTFGSLSGGETHEQYVFDASWVKLREASLTYSLPYKALGNNLAKVVKGIDISITGRNLWLIHKNLPYADPEQGQASGNASMGFQNSAYPMVRALGASLKVKF
ncbi:MAG: SusC/RagA family TonB-linked outer membrane protein [Chitinophagaceae bacterium]|jgi:TonB-linked SusC/RagA family outer membrane protein|nr:SusC/RagA family TonB-linked outer membrane protein [Chitinophagaceae bacterium]